MGAGRQTALWSCLKDLDLPVTLIVGAYDARYSAMAQRMRAVLPTAEAAVVDAAGHTVHLDQPAKFTELVLDALQ
jgi:pimeloyl-ACP methyl ester carboxylesterase